jgi:DNA-binding NtrC family response regulator
MRIVGNNSGTEAVAGMSSWVMSVRRAVARLAGTASCALIHGPIGTGKQRIAREIHGRSRRADAPFVPVDCDVISGTALLDHLFGCVAAGRKDGSSLPDGCFFAADGGTIFLAEVQQLDFDAQARILCLLQRGTIAAEGRLRLMSVDVRVIAATTGNLADEVAAGRFLPQLYELLAAETIGVVPLKDRCEDIPLLAAALLAEMHAERGLPAKRLSAESLRLLCDYDWPGNINELETVLERAVLQQRGDLIGPSSIILADDARPTDLVSITIAPMPSAEQDDNDAEEAGHWPSLAEIQREHIVRTLNFTDGDQQAAARLLDMDWLQFQRQLDQYGLRTTNKGPQIFGNSTRRKAA